MSDAAETPLEDLANISEEERAEILLEIDQISGSSRIEPTKELFNFTARKNSATVPILVNLIGIACLVLGVGLLFLLFRNTGEEIRDTGKTALTAENRLIEAIKQETDAALAQKEAEIENIQAQLSSINTERTTLAAEIQEQLLQQEASLRSQLEAQLAAERDRLNTLNITNEELENRLSAFQVQKNQELNTELAQIRQAAEADRIALENELNELESQFTQSLAAANEARTQLETENQQKLNELQDQYEAQIAASSVQLSQAEAELTRLAQEGEREELVRGQIRGLYNLLNEAIAERDYTTAREYTRDMRSLLNEDSTLRLSFMQEQRPIELFLIRSIESLIGLQQQFGNPETLQRLSDASVLQRANDLTIQAGTAAENGQIEEASRLYQQAIAAIPSINEGYQFLNTQTTQADAASVARANEAAEPIVIDARRMLASNDHEDAFQSFVSVLRNYPNSRFRTEAIRGMQTSLNNILQTNRTEQDDLTTQINELETSVSELELVIEENTAFINTLERNLQESQDILANTEGNVLSQSEQITSLQQEVTAAEARIQTLEATIQEKESQLALLQSATTSERESTAQLLENTSNTLEEQEQAYANTLLELQQAQTTLGTANAELEVLRAQKAQIDQATAELNTLRELEVRLDNAQEVYNTYLQKKDSAANSSSLTDTLTAKEQLGTFLQNIATDFFPSIHNEVFRYEEAFVSSGKENALLDISDFLNITARNTQDETKLQAYQEVIDQVNKMLTN